ncbi:MAG: hypothetical protein IPK19_27395 [Chloroflexi bacterium]|nr:hypothetical protein [Chloroflexota bacterium]
MTNEPNNPPVRLLVHYQSLCEQEAPDLVVAVPGRAIWAAVRLNLSGFVKVIDADSKRQVRFTARSARRRETLLGRPLPAWAGYVAGVTALIDVDAMPGVEILICSDEPAGPRRDHSQGMLMAALWHQVNNLPLDEHALFQLAEAARREYVEQVG